MCGPAGSGKSTWYVKHLLGDPDIFYVSRDEVRMFLLSENDHYFSKEKEVFKQFIDAIQDGVNLWGYDLVIDATHLDKYSRRKLTNALDDALTRPWEIYYIVMDTPYEECCRRNDNRTGRANVPHDVIKEMCDKMTYPQMSEHPNIKGIWIVKE